MSAQSKSPESDFEGNLHQSGGVCSSYALYLFSNNKHALSPDRNSSDKESTNISKADSIVDPDQPSVCLSLLEGNLEAEQETVVRCYLLKTLSAREDLSFENEGKYATLQFSDESNKSFGCYYHRLSKYSSLSPDQGPNDGEAPKMFTFFICLIGPSNGVMESYCTELGNFCYSLIPVLDPEGQKNAGDIRDALNSWYPCCVGYIGRCINTFKEDVAILLNCSLWGNIEVSCEDERTKWDIERFLETSSLLGNSLDDNNEVFKSEKEPPLLIKVDRKDIKLNKSLDKSSYCIKWYEKLKSCSEKDEISLHNILEGFRLKTIQDLNTLKRFLQKAENDHYALYKALLFLQASGYEDILLHHVRNEAQMAREQSGLEIITCLQDFLKSKQSVTAK